MRTMISVIIALAIVIPCPAADLKARRGDATRTTTPVVPSAPVGKPRVLHPNPDPPGKTGIRTVSGFDFSTAPMVGTTGMRVAAGFDSSTQPSPGTIGIRNVSGFDFSTQPAPGSTGARTVQGFDFTKQ